MVEDSAVGPNGAGGRLTARIGRKMRHVDMIWRLGRIPWFWYDRNQKHMHWRHCWLMGFGSAVTGRSLDINLRILSPKRHWQLRTTPK